MKLKSLSARARTTISARRRRRLRDGEMKVAPVLPETPQRIYSLQLPVGYATDPR